MSINGITISGPGGYSSTFNLDSLSGNPSIKEVRRALTEHIRSLNLTTPGQYVFTVPGIEGRPSRVVRFNVTRSGSGAASAALITDSGQRLNVTNIHGHRDRQGVIFGMDIPEKRKTDLHGALTIETLKNPVNLENIVAGAGLNSAQRAAVINAVNSARLASGTRISRINLSQNGSAWEATLVIESPEPERTPDLIGRNTALALVLAFTRPGVGVGGGYDFSNAPLNITRRDGETWKQAVRRTLIEKMQIPDLNAVPTESNLTNLFSPTYNDILTTIPGGRPTRLELFNCLVDYITGQIEGNPELRSSDVRMIRFSTSVSGSAILPLPEYSGAAGRSVFRNITSLRCRTVFEANPLPGSQIGGPGHRASINEVNWSR